MLNLLMSLPKKTKQFTFVTIRFTMGNNLTGTEPVIIRIVSGCETNLERENKIPTIAVRFT